MRLKSFIAAALCFVAASSALAGTMTLMGVGKPAAGGGAAVVCGSGWTGPTSGLTHCWPMDNAHVSGTTIQDAIGSINGTAGANVTAGTGPSGVAGTARTYDGTTQPILLASDPTTTQPLTIATWVNHTNNTSNDAGDQRWLCFGDGAGATEALFANAANVGVADLQLRGSADFNTASVFSSAAWHHYALTYDGTTLIAYVDGVSQTIGAGSGDACVASTWALGGQTATARLWAGSQSTTVIYNRVLSSGEITTLFNAQ